MVTLPTAWQRKADAPTVIFPSRKVLVMGIRWDKHNLHPWVHDLDEGTWSNKMIALSDQTAHATALQEFEEKRKTDKTLKKSDTPQLDEKEIPQLKNEVYCGTALVIDNKVYLIGPCPETNFTICAILDLNTLN